MNPVDDPWEVRAGLPEWTSKDYYNSGKAWTRHEHCTMLQGFDLTMMEYKSIIADAVSMLNEVDPITRKPCWELESRLVGAYQQFDHNHSVDRRNRGIAFNLGSKHSELLSKPSIPGWFWFENGPKLVSWVSCKMREDELWRNPAHTYIKFPTSKDRIIKNAEGMVIWSRIPLIVSRTAIPLRLCLKDDIPVQMRKSKAKNPKPEPTDNLDYISLDKLIRSLQNQVEYDARVHRLRVSKDGRDYDIKDERTMVIGLESARQEGKAGIELQMSVADDSHLTRLEWMMLHYFRRIRSMIITEWLMLVLKL